MLKYYIEMESTSIHGFNLAGFQTPDRVRGCLLIPSFSKSPTGFSNLLVNIIAAIMYGLKPASL